jgi:hypothetical protein
VTFRLRELIRPISMDFDQFIQYSVIVKATESLLKEGLYCTDEELADLNPILNRI